MGVIAQQGGDSSSMSHDETISLIKKLIADFKRINEEKKA